MSLLHIGDFISSPLVPFSSHQLILCHVSNVYLRFFFKILQYFAVFNTSKTAAACDDAVLHLNYIDCSLLRKLFTL